MVGGNTTNKVVLTDRLERFESLVREVYNIDDNMTESTQTVKSKICDMAEILEQHWLAADNPQQVREISNTIARRFRDDGRKHLCDYVYNVLDDRFIRKRDKSSITSPTTVGDVPVRSSMLVEKFVNTLKEIKSTDPVELGKDGAIDIAYEMYDGIKVLENFADENKFELLNSGDMDSDADKQNKSSKKAYGDPITQPDALIPTDEAILTVDQEAYEKGKEYVHLLYTYVEQQNTSNHSQTLEQAIAYREALDSAVRMLKQVLDKKSRRTMYDWAHILAAEAARGGTGASSFSKRIVTDPQTGKALVNRKTLQPIEREITKEQIDARGPKYASELERIIESDSVTRIIQKRYVEITCGLRDWRAYAAHPKLSSVA